MDNDSVIQFKQPAEFISDSLTVLLKNGAQQLIAEAVKKELATLLEEHQDKRLDNGKSAVIRNGYLPERDVQTGVGPVKVRIPKVRDRSGSGIKFNSELIPPYLKRSKNMEEFLPWLYLRGIATGDFNESLSVLFGEQTKGLSASTISRLKQAWEAEHKEWSERDLSLKRYVYIWADGIHFNVRSDESKQCMLVIIGVRDNGKKELVAMDDGYRESEQSWYEMLVELRQRGLDNAPELAVGDGALGWWKALSKAYPQTRHQRCWVHKTANVLNKLPKSVQPKVKDCLHDIWMAETRGDAYRAFDNTVQRFADKYPKAMDCLSKDKDKLLAFYDYPAIHWQHIRSTNVIESTFATVRHRTKKSKNCGSRKTNLAMAFKLSKCAEKKWRKIRGFKFLAEVVRGVQFIDGVKQADQDNREVA